MPINLVLSWKVDLRDQPHDPPQHPPIGGAPAPPDDGRVLMLGPPPKFDPLPPLDEPPPLPLKPENQLPPDERLFLPLELLESKWNILEKLNGRIE